MSRLYTRTLALWLSILCILPAFVAAHMIDIPASKKECFFEDLHVNDKMTVTYQVGGGGHLDIDFWLADPDNQALAKHIKETTGTVSITAEKDGRHEFCFSNQMSTVVDKIVSFNVHGVIYVDSDDTVAPIEREIRALAAGLTSVKDEQEYIVIRERTHRNTAESTNSRVKWWSVLQAIVLFLVVAWQVYYLKVTALFLQYCLKYSCDKSLSVILRGQAGILVTSCISSYIFGAIRSFQILSQALRFRGGNSDTLRKQDWV